MRCIWPPRRIPAILAPRQHLRCGPVWRRYLNCGRLRAGARGSRRCDRRSGWASWSPSLARLMSPGALCQRGSGDGGLEINDRMEDASSGGELARLRPHGSSTAPATRGRMLQYERDCRKYGENWFSAAGGHGSRRPRRSRPGRLSATGLFPVIPCWKCERLLLAQPSCSKNRKH